MKKFYYHVSFFLIVLLVYILASCQDRQQSVTVFVEKGGSQVVIVTAEDPYPIATYAAKELVYHVKLATGIDIPVQNESEDILSHKHRIYIGQSDAARRAGIDHKKLDSEQCVIWSIDGDLYIVGNDGEGHPLDFNNHHSGTLWGVYEVVERLLNVRWLWPGELGTYVPQTDRIEVGEWNEKIKPAMERRHIRTSNHWTGDGDGIETFDYKLFGKLRAPQDYGIGYSSREAVDRYVWDEQIFLRRHRMGRSDDPRPYTGHSFRDWPKEYGEEHPEWFQKLPSGELANDWRERFGTVSGIGHIPEGGWQDHRGSVTKPHKTSMCVSNSEFQQEIINRWKKQRKNNPDKTHILRIGENDNRALCTCEDCRALDAPQPNAKEFNKLPDYVKMQYTPMNAGRRYALFWKNVHKLATEIDPDAIVTAFAYINYFVAPEDVKLHENIILSFCPWGGWWFPRDPREQQWLREQWQRWQNTGATLYYRPNYMHNGGSMPHVFAHQMGEELQYFLKHGSIGTDFDRLTGQWAVNGTTLYLLCRLHNRSCDSIENLLDEYYTAFGPAAMHIKAYFDFWEAHTTTNRVLKGFGGSLRTYHRHAHEMFPPESFERAERILSEAGKAVADETNKRYGRRVEFLRNGLEHARKVMKLALLLDDKEASDEARRKALHELARFRHETEYMHIANFANSGHNDIAAWDDFFDLDIKE